MCNGLIIKRKNNSDLRLAYILFLFLMFLGGVSSVSGQPTLEINVTVQQGINFGEFYPTTGGSVKINFNGSREGFGGVVLLPTDIGNQCVIEIDVNRNRQLVIVNVETPITMVGGGGTMSLDLVQDILEYNTTRGNHKQIINIGGTLHVGDIMSNRSGNYNGTFTITVNGQ